MDFLRDVVERSQEVPVLVDFFAEWCGPCRALAPVLERIGERFRGRLEIVKVDVDRHPELAARLGVRSVPTLKLFHEGRVIGEWVGALPEELLAKALSEALPSPHQKQLERARKLLEEGFREEARQLLEGIDEDEARFLLAKLELFRDPEAAASLLSSLEAPRWIAEAQALKPLLRFLSEPPEKELLREAQEALKREAFREAIEKLLAALAEDRSDRLAREVLLALFACLGDHHPLVQEGRQALALLLF